MSDATGDSVVSVASLELTKNDLLEVFTQLTVESLMEFLVAYTARPTMSWTATLPLFKCVAENLLQAAGDVRGVHPDDWDTCDVTTTIEELYKKLVLDHTSHKTPGVGGIIRDMTTRIDYKVTKTSVDINKRTVFLCKERGTENTLVVSLMDLVSSDPNTKSGRFYLLPS